MFKFGADVVRLYKEANEAHPGPATTVTAVKLEKLKDGRKLERIQVGWRGHQIHGSMVATRHGWSPGQPGR